MPSRTWERLVERFGGTEGAREYARDATAKRRAAGLVRDRRHDRDKPGVISLQRWKSRLVIKAKRRARAAGMEATIRTSDLEWPEFCPVLGVRLLYRNEEGDPGHRVSLDRWDNSKGYVPGNVFVISYRANALKSNANADEIAQVLDYAKHGPVWK